MAIPSISPASVSPAHRDHHGRQWPLAVRRGLERMKGGGAPGGAEKPSARRHSMWPTGGKKPWRAGLPTLYSFSVENWKRPAAEYRS